jgi:hypothetical protein
MLGKMEYISYWLQTRECRLCPAQTTGKANCRLHSQSMSADKSVDRPGRKQATSMSKSLWMMDPTRSREMASCSAIDVSEIWRSSKINSWIWSIISGVVGLRTYQHPGKNM